MLHQVTADQNQQQLFVSPGDTIQIQLEENPTTGYSWALSDVDPFFTIQRNDYELIQGVGIGGGGIRTIQLKVEQSGTKTINLKNWQRWSGDVYQTFTLEVQSV